MSHLGCPFYLSPGLPRHTQTRATLPKGMLQLDGNHLSPATLPQEFCVAKAQMGESRHGSGSRKVSVESAVESEQVKSTGQ